MRILILMVMMGLVSANAAAEEDAVTYASPAAAIKLPEARINGGKPLMQALKERRSSRSFIDKELSDQELSDLLWAAFGINRADQGKRTAPSAMNMQEIDIFVAMQKGLYIYQPERNELKMVLKEDIRAITGKQAFAADAPVNLIFVADHSKMDKAGEMKEIYAAMDAGYISQNVYLYCASQGLATVARGWFDKEALEKAMKLGDGKSVILAQTVGYSE
ncbi:MAG: SagB/ThcOx family dehydrogenase [Candidatus Omnitrophica bacterium]|nr:SagB/ThcOx family dehydrogenase [Candidatus Omnitrophota bacterium]